MLVHVKDMSEKYFIPGETQDMAMMFVPAESIYADLSEHFDDVVQKAHRARIVIVSPSLLAMAIQVMQALVRDARIREEGRVIQIEVQKLLEDVERLDTRVTKLATHFQQAQDDISQVRISTDKIMKRGRSIETLEFEDGESAAQGRIAALAGAQSARRRLGTSTRALSHRSTRRIGTPDAPRRSPDAMRTPSPALGAGRFPLPARRNRAMGLFSKDIKTLDDLFVHTLQDIYYAEQQITKALPEMIEKGQRSAAEAGFPDASRRDQQHVKMVEQVFRMHGHDPKGVTCPAIDGIIDEAQDIAGDVEDPEVLDAALLAAAQAVEHYEITRYGTLVAWAKQLGREDCAGVLHQVLDQEKSADQKLTRIAESKVNTQAA